MLTDVRGGDFSRGTVQLRQRSRTAQGSVQALDADANHVSGIQKKKRQKQQPVWKQHVGLTGGVCPDCYAAPCMPILSVFVAVERRGGWKDDGSMFPACRGQPLFQASRSEPPSPTRHVTSPLFCALYTTAQSL